MGFELPCWESRSVLAESCFAEREMQGWAREELPGTERGRASSPAPAFKSPPCAELSKYLKNMLF